MQRKTVGLLLIVVPLPLLMFVLAAYAIASFVIASVMQAGSETGITETVGSLISVILGLLGVIAIIGLIVGLPLGIYLIVTGDKNKTATVPPTPPVTPNT